MNLATMFGFTRTSYANNELPNIYPMSIQESDFVDTDVRNIYARILTDVLERTQGVPEKSQNLLWDNCVASESSDGLVTLLSKAMTNKRELFLVYERALSLIRKATSDEEILIRGDYKKSGKSPRGIYITFKNYHRTDMVRLYSALEYSTVCSLSKQMKLSSAIQLKFTDLRKSTGLIDSKDVVDQAKLIASGLSLGRDVMLDEKDALETAKPDLTATNSAVDFIVNKQAFYLGMPATYITGESAKGLGDSGQGEAKAVDRGLKNYYFSVIKPVIEEIFGVTTTFKSEDFSQVASSLEALKTFELTSDELLSQDNKRIIINKMFGLPEDEEGDEPEALPAPQLPAPNAKPPVNGEAKA